MLLSLNAPAAAFAQTTPSPEPSPSETAGPIATSSPTPSPTPTTSRVDAARKKLRQEQDPELLELLKQSDKLRAAVDRALREIAQQIIAAKERLDASRKEAIRAAAALKVAEAELRAAIAALAEKKRILAERVAHIYMVGPTALSDFVMTADSMNDAMTKEMYGRAALRADSTAVDDFRAAHERVKRKEEEVRTYKRAVDTQVAASEAEIAALEDLLARQNEIRRQVFSGMSLRAEALSKLLNAKNPYAVVLASYSSAGTGFTDLIREVQKSQKPARFIEHWLRRPLDGRISSGYGWRVHPIYGYLSFHTGIDLSGDSGIPLHPARAGTVIDAGYFGAYGLTVIIDHGNSIATIYSHMSRLDVTAGDELTLESVIGAVGSTGWSTGPHLHFEVRKDGKPDEPTHWF